ncbi:MAG TPA: hypothetical protein VNJ01_05750 [Bacteriovoracaceae bacterium]|nr:hypothetical protein [Bacteriovoracaceae bacterium]
MKENCLHLTREQHLDHMVRVVPLLVLCYGLQCYAILNMKNPGEAGTILSVSGVCLVLMIGAFICYDLKHQVVFYEDHLRVQFFGRVETIWYQDIQKIDVLEPSGSFSKITIQHRTGKASFYFVDSAAAIKDWVQSRQLEHPQAA